MSKNRTLGSMTIRTAACLAVVALAVSASVSCSGKSGDKVTPETAASGGVNGAKLVSLTGVPDKATPGQVFTATFVFQNSGTSTWQQARNFRVGSVGDRFTWGPARLELPTPQVAPGQTVTLSAKLTAPAKDGEYPFEWRMLQEAVEWFGDSTPPKIVSVE